MNALTGAQAVAADQLFMTLDTLTRKWTLAAGREVLLSDTVGFIRDLPHHLVASFRATLAEALHADLLLHVVDAASPDALEQVNVVNEVLKELGAGDRPALLLLNKVDAASDEALLTVIEQQYPEALRISARSGAGLPRLVERVDRLMQGAVRRLRIELPAADGKSLVFLERFGTIHEREYVDSVVRLDVSIGTRALDQLRAQGAALSVAQ
jgi:GTP-binding protein HflX